MKTIVIAIDSGDPYRTYDDLGERLQSFLDEDGDCHILNRLWCVRTDRQPKELYDYLAGGIIQPGDNFFVAALDGPWFCNAKSEGECFKSK